MLGIRLDPDTEAGLTALARRTQRSKSDIAREAIRKHIELHDDVLKAEARRQSLNAARRDDSNDFVFWEAIEAVDEPWS